MRTSAHFGRSGQLRQVSGLGPSPVTWAEQCKRPCGVKNPGLSIFRLQQCAEVEKHRLGGQRQWTIDDPTNVYLVLPANKRKMRILGCVWHCVQCVKLIQIDWGKGETGERWSIVPTCCHCCQGGRQICHHRFFDRTVDHPLVDRSGEYNPDQVSFVRPRNVNAGKCGAKTSDSIARQSWVWFGQKRICAKSGRLICRSGTSQWPDSLAKMLSRYCCPIGIYWYTGRSIQSHLLSIEVDAVWSWWIDRLALISPVHPFINNDLCKCEDNVDINDNGEPHANSGTTMITESSIAAPIRASKLYSGKSSFKKKTVFCDREKIHKPGGRVCMISLNQRVEKMGKTDQKK